MMTSCQPSMSSMNWLHHLQVGSHNNDYWDRHRQSLDFSVSRCLWRWCPEVTKWLFSACISINFLFSFSSVFPSSEFVFSCHDARYYFYSTTASSSFGLDDLGCVGNMIFTPHERDHWTNLQTISCHVSSSFMTCYSFKTWCFECLSTPFLLLSSDCHVTSFSFDARQRLRRQMK